MAYRIVCLDCPYRKIRKDERIAGQWADRHEDGTGHQTDIHDLD